MVVIVVVEYRLETAKKKKYIPSFIIVKRVGIRKTGESLDPKDNTENCLLSIFDFPFDNPTVGVKQTRLVTFVIYKHPVLRLVENHVK